MVRVFFVSFLTFFHSCAQISVRVAKEVMDAIGDGGHCKELVFSSKCTRKRFIKTAD